MSKNTRRHFLRFLISLPLMSFAKTPTLRPWLNFDGNHDYITLSEQPKHPELWKGLVGIWIPGRDGYSGNAKNYCVNFII